MKWKQKLEKGAKFVELSAHALLLAGFVVFAVSCQTIKNLTGISYGCSDFAELATSVATQEGEDPEEAKRVAEAFCKEAQQNPEFFALAVKKLREVQEGESWRDAINEAAEELGIEMPDLTPEPPEVEEPEVPELDFRFEGPREGDPQNAQVIGTIEGLSFNGRSIAWASDDRNPNWKGKHIGHAFVNTVCYLEQGGKATKFEWCRKEQFSVTKHNIYPPEEYMGWVPVKGEPARLILANTKGTEMVISGPIPWR